LDKAPPEDNVFVQINEENKFLGDMLWKVFDFMTLGTFENNM
jgi:hypothetical protein